MMMDLGFPESSDGFGYLRAAVVIKVGNMYLRFGDIYQRVAHLHGEGTSIQQVEQDIRSLIGDAWKYRNVSKWMIVFPPDGRGKHERPTNGKVIARFANLLELWENCCEEVSYAG
jgi:hypothetical protein